MNPRLIAIAGASRGATYALGEGEIKIGRDPANQICIGDPSLSRRHCLITREGERFKINDLESRNGTFVNGVPVKERLLEPGDQIQIGDCLLLFLLEAHVAPAAGVTQLDEGAFATRSRVRLRVEDALYLQPEKMLTSPLSIGRMARDLSALVRISTMINSILDIGALQRQLLQLIFETLPADRGAILLVGQGSEEFDSICTLGREPDPDRPLQVSRTIANEVLREGIALVSDCVDHSNAAGMSKSLIAAQVRSLLCVPLVIFEKALGVIYLDTSDPNVRFEKDDLQLMTAIAGIAAVAIENARHMEQLESENQRLLEDLQIEHNMVGESDRMRQVYQFIAKVAPSDSTVLIRGESGTGKELAARAIHRNSPRNGKPFVAINCAALTEPLLESELFGHEKGAFTGAIAQKKGKLEVADGGTVFLDEVGDVAPPLQAKLLRVLQEREFERVGGTHPIKLDIRLIAATNQNLEDAIREGTFREDLYYRINVVSLTMPPLRERREDISLLASYFAAKYGKKLNRRVTGLTPDARSCLMNYHWPGNVRELENAIERAVVLGSTDLIGSGDLPETVLETAAIRGMAGLKYYERIIELKKQFILEALEQAAGNYTEAAKLLGMHPNNLHRLARNLDLKAPRKK